MIMSLLARLIPYALILAMVISMFMVEFNVLIFSAHCLVLSYFMVGLSACVMFSEKEGTWQLKTSLGYMVIYPGLALLSLLFGDFDQTLLG